VSAAPGRALERLGDWTARLNWASLPAEQQALVPLRVLDTLGLVLAGSTTDAAHIVTSWALAQGGREVASLVGGEAKVPAGSAALVHGTIAHCRDFDDTFTDSVVHPGSVVIPVALAAGEATQAAREAIGAGIVAGYEIAARVGAAAGRRFHARGVHPTGVVGPIAAAATASRVLGLQGETTAWAMGLACSMAGGLTAFISDGAWSKWLHAGWAAHGGLLAAELAARGFRGPLGALDGANGLYHAFLFGEAPETSAWLADLGDGWRGAAAQFKYYPCAHVIQPYLDGAIEIAAARSVSADEVSAVRCRIAPWAAPIVCRPAEKKIAPASELEAIASLPYMLAYAIAENQVTLDALAASARARADLRLLAQRISCEEDSSLGSGFDSFLEIEFRDGSREARSNRSAPPDADKIVRKFVANASPILGSELAARAAAELLDRRLPELDAARRILSARRIQAEH
jgi:2-methylcitrate dehydratase PrpD